MSSDDLIAGALAFLIVSTLFLVAIFGFAILGTLMGAFTGWVISVTPLKGLVETGLSVFGFNAEGHLPHIGAALGFVSGFIKGIVEVKKEDGEK